MSRQPVDIIIWQPVQSALLRWENCLGSVSSKLFLSMSFNVPYRPVITTAKEYCSPTAATQCSTDVSWRQRTTRLWREWLGYLTPLSNTRLKLHRTGMQSWSQNCALKVDRCEHTCHGPTRRSNIVYCELRRSVSHAVIGLQLRPVHTGNNLLPVASVDRPLSRLPASQPASKTEINKPTGNWNNKRPRVRKSI